MSRESKCPQGGLLTPGLLQQPFLGDADQRPSRESRNKGGGEAATVDLVAHKLFLTLRREIQVAVETS